MAIVVKNTNYNGEVLEQILTLAATGNEIVEKGLIMVIPGVEKKISLPRLKSGKMLQKRKEHPGIEDSKGNFNYSEKSPRLRADLAQVAAQGQPRVRRTAP